MQRVKAELRDEGPSINVIKQSDMATGVDEKKATTEPLIWKATIKQESLDLQNEKETFVATRKDFSKDEEYTSKAPTNLIMDDEVKPFLQACMKLLHNQKVVENLQTLIDSCAERNELPTEVRDVHKQ